MDLNKYASSLYDKNILKQASARRFLLIFDPISARSSEIPD